MTKDFANVSSVRDNPPRDGLVQHQGTSTIGRVMLVLALVIVVAAAFAGGHYLGQQHGINQQKIAEKLKMQQQLKQQNREIDRLKKELATKPVPKNSPLTTEVGELTFYDDLINDKVDPGGDNNSAKVSRKEEKNVADIIAQSQQHGANHLPIYIQLGSFADETIAKGVKQRVVALGMISYIQPVTLSGSRHRFRVQVGPYPNMKHAVKARKTLQHKLHMSGLIIRVKR